MRMVDEPHELGMRSDKIDGTDGGHKVSLVPSSSSSSSVPSYAGFFILQV